MKALTFAVLSFQTSYVMAGMRRRQEPERSLALMAFVGLIKTGFLIYFLYTGQ